MAIYLKQKLRLGIGVRHLIIFLLFLCTIIAMGARSTMSIAMVAMTDNSDNPDFEEFDWDSSAQSIILSSFSWSYTLLLMVWGRLLQVFGAKHLLCMGMVVAAIGTVFVPLAATSAGWIAVCCLRIVQGGFHATLLPSLYFLMSNWTPLHERGRMFSFIFVGVSIGTIVGNSVGGILAQTLGWPSIFYVFGGVAIVWSIIWFVLGASCPAEHSFISTKEREYIQSSLAATTKKEMLRTPWIAILKSAPVWAILFPTLGYNWGFNILMVEMPSYIKTVLQYNVQNSGLFSSVPYVAQGVLTFIFGVLSDMSMKRKWITLTWSRKLFNSIGFFGPAVALACLGYIDKSHAPLGVALLVISVGLGGAAVLGYSISCMDISPNYGSMILSATYSIASILTIAGPLIVGAVVTDEGSTDQWRIIFWCTAVSYVLTNAIYLVFGRTDRQPWDPVLEEVEEVKNSEVKHALEA